MVSPAKILVVEDERIIAADIATAQAIKPDLVLMDIALEGNMNGVEAAQRIRSVLDIPVVYLTAYSKHPLMEHSRQPGVVGCIVKPFEDSELLDTIELARDAQAVAREAGCVRPSPPAPLPPARLC